MTYEQDQAAYKASPNAEEMRFMSMSANERRDHIDRMEHAAARAEHVRKEAELQRMVEQQTALSVSRNRQLNFGGQTITRVNGDGTTSTEHRSEAIRHVAVDMTNIPVTIGGIQLGPEQARQMVADGMVSQEDYRAALNAEAHKRGGVPSFK